jgi:hypothetical protein
MKKQINPTIKVYFIRGAFYLVLFGVCAIPFALARQSLKNPRSELQQHQQATALSVSFGAPAEWHTVKPPPSAGNFRPATFLC